MGERPLVTINGDKYEFIFEMKMATTRDDGLWFEFHFPREIRFEDAVKKGLVKKVSDSIGVSTTPRTTFSFRMEDNESVTEQDLDRMIGDVMPVLFFGRNVPAKITNAHRYSDQMLGPGIWIEAEYVGS